MNTTVNVLSGGEATVSPSQAQAMAGGTGLRVVASEPTDFSLLGLVASPRVGHVVCEADCTFLSLPASLEKAAGAQVTLRVAEEQRFFDSTHTIDERVDALDLRATAKMTPAQAASYVITKGTNGLLHVVLAGGGEFDLRPFSVGKYDALMLQGTDALVSTAQGNALPSVHRDDGKVVLVADNNALPSDISFADTIDVLRSSVPITLNLAQALNVTVEHAPMVTLQLSADADLSVLNLNHVQRVESTRTVRLSHAQWKAMSHVSAATVILAVRSAEDLRSTSLDGVHTLECFDACKATVEQVQGKTIVGGTTHLACYAEGNVPASFSLEGVRTLVGTNAVVLPAQYRQVASVEGAVIILVPHRTVENFLGDPLTGVALRVEGSATLSVAQYKGISVTRAGTGTVTVVASGGDEMLDRVDHINTIRINAGAALTMDVADLSSVTVHKEGGLLYGSVKEDAVAADYPLVDGFYVQAGTFTVRQADQGRVVSNHAVVRLEGATAAPTAPGEVNIVVAPFEPTSLALASPSIGEILALAGPVIDPHLATVNPSIQWFADGNLVGSGDTLLVPQSLTGASVFASVSWTVPWLRLNAEGHYSPSAPSLVRQFNTAPSIVNTAGIGSIEGEDLFVGDDVRLVLSDSDGVGTVLSRAWYREGVPTGESGDAYTLTSLDFGTVLSCAFSFRDGRGVVETGTAVRPRLPPLEATVPVTSLPVGEALPAVSLSRGAQAFGVQWFSVSQSQQTVYTAPLVYGSTGTEFYARVTTPEGVVVETPRIPVAAYASTGHVSVVGIPQTGETLTISSTVQDLNAARAGNEEGTITVADFASFEWFRCDNAQGDNLVVVATDQTLLLADAVFQGFFVGVRGAYVDGTATNTVTSTPVAFNARGGLTIDTPVAVSLLVPGDSIFATVADADGVEVRQVAWRRGGTTVSSTLDYTLEASNFGEPLEVNVTYADGMGHTETLSSTILLPSKIPLVRFADLHGQLMTGLRAGANYFLRVSPALVGLPFDVLVDGTAVSSGSGTGTQRRR